MKSFFLGLSILATTASVAHAAPIANTCKNLPSHEALKKSLSEAQAQKNGGLDAHMWGVIVDRGGVVCQVVYTGREVGDQWPGSRVIAEEKAFTANGLSVAGSAFSTANLYAGTQPGGFMSGLTTTNPVDAAKAYAGDGTKFGSPQDPMVGERIGGVVTFGGGLALYNKAGELIGGLGVSGDTSCADHNVAWRTRASLELDYVPKGVAKDKSDNIIYDIRLGTSSSGFGHPTCIGDEKKISEKLPKIRSHAAAEKK